jgi:hypothetical protein
MDVKILSPKNLRNTLKSWTLSTCLISILMPYENFYKICDLKNIKFFHKETFTQSNITSGTFYCTKRNGQLCMS